MIGGTFSDDSTLGLMNADAGIGSPPRPRRSRVLRVLSVFLLAGALLNFAYLPTALYAQYGATYQAVAFVAALVTLTAAIGIWQHKLWGALLYTALAVLTQPALMLLGLWIWGALVVPGIVVLVLFWKRAYFVRPPSSTVAI
jgi:hypothetical protein